MPVPLIAAALIAGGVITGGSGVVLGGQGAVDMKRARDSLKREQAKLEADGLLTEEVVAATNTRLERLGEQQMRALTDVVLRMGEFLRRNHKKVRESERLLVDGVDVTFGAVPSMKGLDPDAVVWIRGLVGSAAAGSGTAAGVTATAGAVGVASTGAAISGLSGAAAESATLAFLGGGSLASGGGGMALGATALNFVTVGPALLVGGLVTKGQGTRARTQARDHQARVAIAMADNELTRTKLAGVDARVAELGALLERLVERGMAALDLLESELFVPEDHASEFQRAMGLAVAVRDVAATPVVDGAGDLNEKTSGFEVKYRPMVEDEDG